MQPHQERVVEEETLLNEKIEKLETFIGGDKFLTIDRSEQERLKEQLTHMMKYTLVLRKRIHAFGE